MLSLHVVIRAGAFSRHAVDIHSLCSWTWTQLMRQAGYHFTSNSLGDILITAIIRKKTKYENGRPSFVQLTRLLCLIVLKYIYSWCKWYVARSGWHSLVGDWNWHLCWKRLLSNDLFWWKEFQNYKNLRTFHFSAKKLATAQAFL